MASVFVALPCLMFGGLGLAGRLADVSHQSNIRFALPFLNVAGAIIGIKAAWFFWLYHHRRTMK
jgi:hypothetical protein